MNNLDKALRVVVAILTGICITSVFLGIALLIGWVIALLASVVGVYGAFLVIVFIMFVALFSAMAYEDIG